VRNGVAILVAMARTRGPRALLVTLLAVTALGACGGTPSTPSAGPGSGSGSAAPTAAAAGAFPDSCALVTKEEASAVLGITVTRTQKTSNGICMYESDDLSDPWLGTDILDDHATRLSFDQYIEGAKDKGSVYPVAGVGDAADYVDLATEGIRMISLYILRGNIMFAIGNLENLKGQKGQTQPLPAVRTLALQALARLR
jgi:hypothetical protein